MTEYLVVLIWPGGLAVIFGTAFLLARKHSVTAAPAAAAAGTGNRETGRHQARRADARSPLREAAKGSGQVLVVGIAGALVVFGVMSLLGLGVVYHGLSLDRPVFHWLQGHHVHVMTAVLRRLTKIGDTWTTWGAALAAAACLAVTCRTNPWLPPVTLASLIVVDHYTTQYLRHEFHRLGPPTSPLGTYPSGGCDRSIAIYGLIAYLLWREFSGRRATAYWAAAAVAALGFNEAYSRVYLSLHWCTDALSGLLYGSLLLLAFVAAVRLVIGPPVIRRSGAPAVGPPATHAPASHAPATHAPATHAPATGPVAEGSPA